MDGSEEQSSWHLIAVRRTNTQVRSSIPGCEPDPRPLSDVAKPVTFSIRSSWGRRSPISSRIRRKSPRSPDSRPFSPALPPANETSVHGNDAVAMSTAGTALPVRSRISASTNSSPSKFSGIHPLFDGTNVVGKRNLHAYSLKSHSDEANTCKELSCGWDCLPLRHFTILNRSCVIGTNTLGRG